MILPSGQTAFRLVLFHSGGLLRGPVEVVELDGRKIRRPVLKRDTRNLPHLLVGDVGQCRLVDAGALILPPEGPPRLDKGGFGGGLGRVQR